MGAARAVRGLPCQPALVFIDGNDRPPLNCAVEMVVGGDALIASIAAASIVAKVTRDRLMSGLGLAFPGYGFERHMGYGTAEHGAALRELGPAAIIGNPLPRARAATAAIRGPRRDGCASLRGC